MKRFVLFFFLFHTILLSFFVVSVESATYDLNPFHTKEEKISMWKELWDGHPNGNYESVGKTYNGKDIWLFSIGNPAGGRVLWDGEMHGGEDKGSEILFLMAKWLLESEDSRAVKILESNYVMFIPVINDRIYRGNGNLEASTNGVDLNRNFENGWSYQPPGDDEYCYSGAYPVSEPETAVMRNVFSSYEPVFYVNMHSGAGPYAAYYSSGNRTLSELVNSRTLEICNEMNIIPYPNFAISSTGFAIGDAVDLGVQSAWLIECVGSSTAGLHLPEHYEELVSTYFPKCLALFIVMCDLCGSESQIPYIQSITRYPTTYQVSCSNPVIVTAILGGNTDGIKQMTLNCATDYGENYVVGMVQIEENMWHGEISSFLNGTTVSYTLLAEDVAGNVVSSDVMTYQCLDYVAIPEPSIDVEVPVVAIPEPSIDVEVPVVTILSPKNRTYNATQIPLEFTVSEPVSWIAYCLDGKENITISENMTLLALANSSYNLKIYANDITGNTGASQTMFFDVSQETHTPEHADVVTSGLFSTNLLVATIALASVVGIVLVFYFRKKRH